MSSMSYYKKSFESCLVGDKHFVETAGNSGEPDISQVLLQVLTWRLPYFAFKLRSS